jgi:hypothetical protein
MSSTVPAEPTYRQLRVAAAAASAAGDAHTDNAHTQLSLRLRDVQAQEQIQAQEICNAQARLEQLVAEEVHLRCQIAAAHNRAEASLLRLPDHLLSSVAAHLSVQDLGRFECVSRGAQTIVQGAVETALAQCSQLVRDRAAELRSGPEALPCLRVLLLATTPFTSSWASSSTHTQLTSEAMTQFRMNHAAAKFNVRRTQHIFCAGLSSYITSPADVAHSK